MVFLCAEVWYVLIIPENKDAPGRIRVWCVFLTAAGVARRPCVVTAFPCVAYFSMCCIAFCILLGTVLLASSFRVSVLMLRTPARLRRRQSLWLLLRRQTLDHRCLLVLLSLDHTGRRSYSKPHRHKQVYPDELHCAGSGWGSDPSHSID